MNVIAVDTIYGPLFAFEGDFITKQIAKFGAHTRTEVAFLRSVIAPGDFIFDLGAHIGTYTIALADKAGAAGKVLAVEGSTENFRLLERNLAMERPGARTTPVHALVARSGCRYRAHTPEGNTGGTYFLPAHDASAETVEPVTLDELCDRHFVPRLVKMDIEGGEVLALANSALLARHRPIVYAEVNRQALLLQDASIAEMERLLKDAGYRLFRNVGTRHAAHDDFVVAELPSLPTHLNNFDVLAVHKDDDRLAALAAAL